MYHEKLRSLWIFLCKLYQINILIYYICIVGRVLLEDWKTTLWSKWKAVLNREYVNFYKSKSSIQYIIGSILSKILEKISPVYTYSEIWAQKTTCQHLFSLFQMSTLPHKLVLTVDGPKAANENVRNIYSKKVPIFWTNFLGCTYWIVSKRVKSKRRLFFS